eukprot:1184786-Prorocentrum_minimum.AAC.1
MSHKRTASKPCRYLQEAPHGGAAGARGSVLHRDPHARRRALPPGAACTARTAVVRTVVAVAEVVVVGVLHAGSAELAGVAVG